MECLPGYKVAPVRTAQVHLDALWVGRVGVPAAEPHSAEEHIFLKVSCRQVDYQRLREIRIPKRRKPQFPVVVREQIGCADLDIFEHAFGGAGLGFGPIC